MKKTINILSTILLVVSLLAVFVSAKTIDTGSEDVHGVLDLTFTDTIVKGEKFVIQARVVRDENYQTENPKIITDYCVINYEDVFVGMEEYKDFFQYSEYLLSSFSYNLYCYDIYGNVYHKYIMINVEEDSNIKNENNESDDDLAEDLKNALFKKKYNKNNKHLNNKYLIKNLYVPNKKSVLKVIYPEEVVKDEMFGIKNTILNYYGKFVAKRCTVKNLNEGISYAVDSNENTDTNYLVAEIVLENKGVYNFRSVCSDFYGNFYLLDYEINVVDDDSNDVNSVNPNGQSGSNDNSNNNGNNRAHGSSNRRNRQPHDYEYDVNVNTNSIVFPKFEWKLLPKVSNTDSNNYVDDSSDVVQEQNPSVIVEPESRYWSWLTFLIIFLIVIIAIIYSHYEYRKE